ncbi:DUF5686 and carboxypeptidase regulatory-like domain-containing protein [Ferruginibacter yonginensis]|uniref:DUF5686 and carboxypeptidase regulatory-like domain-containing protein n=1 Tax=Ferruginibacter yonginensis TaxID=1310416 RepID=A0ABV8QRV0_9BACT
MRLYILAILLCCQFNVIAQKVTGTIFTAQGDLLPYSSITIKGTTKGTSANEKAKYAMTVAPGTYTFVCQHLGYAAVEKKITVTGDVELSFVLSDVKLNLETVVIRNDREDPAYEIIRNAIKKRNYFSKQVNQFTCNIYGKDLIKLNALPKRILGRKVPDEDRKDMGLDSSGKGIIYLAENISKVSIQQPDKLKLEVISSRVSGSDGFGFSFPSFISLYNNNVKVFTERLNPRGFVSPIADGAIGFYKFKFLGTFFENGKSISSIRVTPRRLYEPLFSGIINIIDDEWSIHSFDLMLTKTAQLEIMDTLQITQLHVAIDNDIRRVKNQLLHFNVRQLGIDVTGNFLTVYSDYNINPKFPKKYFDNVVIKYDTGVNKKSKAYWDTVRAVPLEQEEMLDYQKKDSILKVTKDSSMSKRYIDSVNKSQRKIKPLDIFTAGIGRYRYNKKGSINWRIEPLVQNAEYNPAEGVVVQLKGAISKNLYNSRSSVALFPVIRYGFSNTHLNAYASLVYNIRTQDSARKLKRYAIAVSGGKRVSEFNKQGVIPPLNNSISTLFYGKNYMKTYENTFGAVTFSKRYESGVRLAVSGLYENRIPLNNTTNFTFYKKDSIKITPNYPVEQLSSQFQQHQAAIIAVSFSFKPGQRYIQFPNYKASIGSKYPTFTLNYSKGINKVFGSDVDFDKWSFNIQDDKNLKLAGLLKYKIGVGGFLNNKQVFFQDYQHFNGNRTAGASAYVNSYQLASYYANSTNANVYAIGHLEHHFNGLFTNKIPFFRKLNWNLVAGSNAFYVNKNNHYVEVFGGIENILKVFRVDVVVGYDQKNNTSSGIRIGAGGLLGASFNRGANNNIDIGF